MKLNVVRVGRDYKVTPKDEEILYAGELSGKVFLPPAKEHSGRVLVFVHRDGLKGTPFLIPAQGDSIKHKIGQTPRITAGGFMTIVSDGVDCWDVISEEGVEWSE